MSPTKRRVPYDWNAYYRDNIAGDPDRVVEFEQGLAECEISVLIYDLRHAAGLTQAQLAKRVGTTASVISRLEDADYDGHSLGMLRRIAAALGRKVEIRLVRTGRRAPAARRKSRSPARRKPKRKKRAA